MASRLGKGTLSGGYALAAASDSDNSEDEAERQLQADEFVQAQEDERQEIAKTLIRTTLTSLLLSVTDEYATCSRARAHQEG